MTVFGICMCKDEADIIATTVTHMRGQVDEIIILDNGSTDGTLDILADLEVYVLRDDEVGYYQSAKTTQLARAAANMGASWVVPFDADEIWYAPFHKSIAAMVEDLAPQWLTAEAKLYDHVATGADPAVSDPVGRLGWRRRAHAPLGKVACRCRNDLVIEQGNHGASYDGGTTRYTDHLVVRHFPYRSPEQFVKKVRNGAAAYAATDLPENVGAHWRGYGQILADSGERVLVDEVFRPWFFVSDPASDPTLIWDPAPVDLEREEYR